MHWKDLLFKKKLLFHAISIALFALITLVYCWPITEGKIIYQGSRIFSSIKNQQDGYQQNP